MTGYTLHRVVCLALLFSCSAIASMWIIWATQGKWRAVGISVAWFIFCVVAGILARQAADRYSGRTNDDKH